MTSLQGLLNQFEHASLLHHHPATEGKADAATTMFGGEEGDEERLAVFGIIVTMSIDWVESCQTVKSDVELFG